MPNFRFIFRSKGRYMTSKIKSFGQNLALWEGHFDHFQGQKTGPEGNFQKFPEGRAKFLGELILQNIISTPNYYFLVNSPPNGPESQGMYVTNFSDWRAILRCGEVSRNIPLTGKFLSSEGLYLAQVWSVHSRDRNHGGKMPYLPGHRRWRHGHSGYSYFSFLAFKH